MPHRERALLLLLAGALVLACSSEAAKATRDDRTGYRAPARLPQPDTALTNYVEWNRDWMLLANRHKSELDAEMAGITARHPFAGSYKVVQDTQLLALLERQRGEMRPLMSRAPRGLTAAAMSATLSGIGHAVIGEHGVSWVPGHDEPALHAARARYGDTFVDWVLARESGIVARLATVSAPQ